MFRKLFFIFFLFLIFENLSFAVSDDEYLLKSDFKNAYILYSKNLNSEKSPQNYLNMCKVTYYLNDDIASKKFCKEALNLIDREKNPDVELRSDILSMVGNLYANVYRNTDMTFDYYNQAKVLKENNPLANKYELIKLYRNIAFAYNFSGDKNLSYDYWQKALKILENEKDKKYNILSAIIYNDLALVERKNQNYEKSKEYLDKAVNLIEQSEDYINYNILSVVYENLAIYYENSKKDKNEAIRYYKEAALANAKFPQIIESDKADKDITISELESILNEYPYDISYNLLLGKKYLVDNEDKAKKYFDKAISVNPRNPYIYVYIASLYSEKYAEEKDKNYLKESKYYLKYAEKYSNYIKEIYLSIANVYLNIDSIINANMYFDFYIKYSEDKALANAEIASCFWYKTNIKYRNYVAYYLERALKISSDIDVMYKIMLVAAYRQMNNNKKADETLRKYILKNKE